MKISDLNIAPFVSEAFGTNTYLVHKKGCSDCIIIDPGFDPELIIKQVNKEKLIPVAILITHGHMDHIAGVAEIKKCWDTCKIIIGKEDASKLLDPAGNLSGSFGFPMKSLPPDETVVDGEKLNLAGLEILVLHLPGHSKGHVIYQIPMEDNDVIFVGDVIFMDSIGRTDFPDGNYSDLMEGIRTKILTLSGETILYTGHGDKTTVGRERRYNPFLAGDVC